MEFAPAGVVLSCEVTFDSPSLDVGMTVYDDTGSVPVLLLSTFAMLHVAGNTYRGKFTGVAGKNYIVIKAVYTDETLTVVDQNYSQGSESIVSQDLPIGGGSQGCSVVGIVDNNQMIIGKVTC